MEKTNNFKENEMRICGIYRIRNKVNDKVYVGQSVNVKARFSEHRYNLKKGIHCNTHLQRAWNKYGEDNFEFRLILECDKEHLSENESREFHSIPRKLTYNSVTEFVSFFGEKNPFYGKNHTDEAKLRMSEAKKGKYIGDNNPNYGGKNAAILRARMNGSKNCNAKLNENDVTEIRQLLNEKVKHAEIAVMFGVSRTVVTRINSGARWAHLKS